MKEKSKKTIFSGIQPTNYPHLGNYIGAIKNWSVLQEEYNCLYCIVDLHAITVRQNPAELRRYTRNLLALLIACGLDPEKNLLYVQSHVSGHAELSWILSCFTYMGELSRMTQYKEKAAKHEENINAGLFTYPVLMASDILLFDTDLVPVGDDQRQHLELARDVAVRFNNVYGDVFTVPESFIPKSGARIKSLTEPDKKMSKSDEAGSLISLLDSPEDVRRKFKRAVTDSEAVVRHDPAAKPGISNLLEIYAAACEITVNQAQGLFEGKGYGQLKNDVADAVIENIILPIKRHFDELTKEPKYLEDVMAQNSEKARALSKKMLDKVRKKIGLLA